MEIVTSVDFSDVRRAYARDHPLERTHEANTNADGVQALALADQDLHDWWHVRLSRADVLRVVLPWHLSEGGARELVPRSGLTVAQAAERIRDGGADWTADNPVCAHKLVLMERAPLTPIYLSTRAIAHSDYSDLKVREGLIHIDGLHRMLAWELAGRLADRPELDCFLAGDPQLPVGAEDAPHRARPAGSRTEDDQA
ncbi:DUF6309 family protein [Streptomyces sp. NPDC049906]|uniref:DUF6309 family protein n=1 Tax=Streptomyces sp. NPDC049906 TaxID=3155656 RepID=UPI0034364794